MTEQQMAFRLEEATIAELHQAIRSGRTTCFAVVQHYIELVRASTASLALALVAEDGALLADEPTGTVRAGAPLRFPRDTFRASTILPDLDKYIGPRSNSDAWSRLPPILDVMQQFGMIAGIPDAGQVMRSLRSTFAASGP